MHILANKGILKELRGLNLLMIFATVLIYSAANSENNNYSAMGFDTLKITDSLINALNRNTILEGEKLTDYSELRVDSLLANNTYQAKIKAAYVLSESDIIDTTRALQILKDLLVNEILKPDTTSKSSKSLYSSSSILKQHYCAGIVKLLGNDIKRIDAYADSIGGEIRKRLIISLANLGDTTIRDDLNEIYLNENDTNICFQAIMAMNNNPNNFYIPTLKKALDDNTYSIDIFGNRSYVIRTAAACTLMKLGFELSCAGQYKEIYIITKEPTK
jgi:hypothetical protein